MNQNSLDELKSLLIDPEIIVKTHIESLANEIADHVICLQIWMTSSKFTNLHELIEALDDFVEITDQKLHLYQTKLINELSDLNKSLTEVIQHIEKQNK